MKIRLIVLRATFAIVIGAFGVASGCAHAVTGELDEEGGSSGSGDNASSSTTGAGAAGAGGMGSSSSSASNGSGGTSCMPETCNGLDDDCDGFVDDSPMGVGDPCTTNLPGPCSTGTQACKSGAIVCEQTVMPGIESCNGVDDDCDGTIDDGNPGGGGACSTGLSGPCSAGTLTCSSGVIMCAASVQPVAEVCGDGVDNDCNGTVDDGCGGGTCAHSPCVSGVALDPACDSCVDLVCLLDSFCCDVTWDSLCASSGQSYCVCP